jgi:integrase/recombinase XerD
MDRGLVSSAKSGEIDSLLSTRAILRDYFTEISGLSPLTVKVRRWDIALFLKFLGRQDALDLSKWLPLDTARFRTELIRDGYAPSTINRILSSLRCFAKWGRGKHWQLEPTKGVADLQLAPPVPKALSETDFYKISKAAELLTLRAPKKYDESRRNRALVSLLASSGLRIAEVLNLRVHNLQGRRLVGVLTKRSKIRDVLLSKDAAEIVRAYLEQGRTPGSDYLFTNRYGEGLSRNGVALALSRLAQLASTKNHQIHCNPHAFRHRLGKRVRELAGDVAAARKLGHANTRLIELYATTTEAEDEALTDAL